MSLKIDKNTFRSVPPGYVWFRFVPFRSVWFPPGSVWFRFVPFGAALATGAPWSLLPALFSICLPWPAGTLE